MYKRPYNPHTRYYLRGLAGLYLLYLAWSLRQELTKPGFMKLAPILFTLIGLAFAGTAAYAIFWKDTPPEEWSQDDPSGEEAASGEDAVSEENDDEELPSAGASEEPALPQAGEEEE